MRVLLATVREHQERAAPSLEMTSSYETSLSANGSAIAAGCYLDPRVLDKEINLTREAELEVRRQGIDELEKEKKQTQRNDRLQQEKRLEAEQVAQSKRIDEL